MPSLNRHMPRSLPLTWAHRLTTALTASLPTPARWPTHNLSTPLSPSYGTCCPMSRSSQQNGCSLFLAPLLGPSSSSALCTAGSCPALAWRIQGGVQHPPWSVSTPNFSFQTYLRFHPSVRACYRHSRLFLLSQNVCVVKGGHRRSTFLTSLYFYCTVSFAYTALIHVFIF